MSSVDEFFSHHLDRYPVMAIFRGRPPAETLDLCRAAWSTGVDLIEVPVQGPEARESFRAAVRLGASEGKHVGAGTVLSVEQLEAVSADGAAFTVAPGFDAEVVSRARELGVPHLPGVATATEIDRALRAGCRWLKAFPAAQLGVGWAGAQGGPFPDAAFVATGGIDAENAADFLTAGYRAVAVGSAFTSTSGIERLSAALSKWSRL
ncbi:2-dehydro-3-deoxyphosphogluconate aldolase [Aeromicrobium sp. PE09-221]|uniref:bifunctional 4-hydroxy-2-oxoglutarate aldolase/2-dehydro-3-deoxy-phosphogluconate aldolase n=1 Tax=Aeromicrobium sp. PE09-221 TaxID=1898043 RepID=UPI000B3E56A6|nr:bifunctional 4-hydroxy-2-oxoglutarate aldolase/2-dehydro-3-deoxy-phosphogluconate aldolase [Aeromicrobium sp. PE09-221]OUZ11605.1 2-dehydro-3-deoxyphosphogluconate aldolase [Aeromicrobium sp. PE09-221]